MIEYLQYTLLIVGAYFLGSLSSAIIVCKIMAKPDPRTTGSNNPGATNVLRVAGKAAGALTLAGDVLKGLLPVLLVAWWFKMPALSLAVLLAALLGHLFPIFFKFQGGKGVATALGGVFAFSIWLGAAFVITWALVVAITRYVSLGSILGFLVLPLVSGFLYGQLVAAFFVIVAVIVLIRHRENIQRLRQGQESKLFKKSRV